MTKFILAGGNDKRVPGGIHFYNELIKVDGPVRLLECLFSREESVWQAAYDEDVQFISERTGAQLETRLATRQSFLADLEWSNVVFFRGGDTGLLIDAMRTYPEWGKRLENKTVAGSSAGAHMLSAYHYGLHSLQIEKGLGLVPVKVIVHFESDFNTPHIDWKRALSELRAHDTELPLITLREGEHSVIEQ